MGVTTMKTRTILALALMLATALCLAGPAAAKSVDLEEYRLCAEGGIGNPEVPEVRFDLVVNKNDTVGGTAVVAHAGQVVNYVASGPIMGDKVELTGRGWGPGDDEYKAKFHLMLGTKSEAGQFKYVSMMGGESKTFEGELKVVGCVKRGAKQ
jgi:hypothetical protein